MLPAHAEVSVTDDTGARVTLHSVARRIVSLSPHNTENIFAAGAGTALVGVASYSDYPTAANALPRVGDAQALNLEGIVALRPDLIVAWDSGNAKPQIEQLRRLGIPIFISEPLRLEDIATNIEAFGKLAGTDTVARTAAAQWRQSVGRLRDSYAQRRPISVFFEIWNQPLMTINGQHIITQIINLCGGKNVFSDLTPLAPEVSREAVIAAAPQVIIVTSKGEKRAPWLDEWRRLPQLLAVKRGQLFAIRPDVISRQTTRLLEGAEQLCKQLDSVRLADPAQRPR